MRTREELAAVRAEVARALAPVEAAAHRLVALLGAAHPVVSQLHAARRPLELTVEGLGTLVAAIPVDDGDDDDAQAPPDGVSGVARTTKRRGRGAAGRRA